MLSMSGGSGNLQAVYTIDVPDGSANEVAQRLTSSSPDADSQILSDKIAAAGLSATYPETKVVSVSATPGPTTAPNPCDTTTLAPTPAPNPCDTTTAAGPTPAPS